jgi:hypothetical protein
VYIAPAPSSVYVEVCGEVVRAMDKKARGSENVLMPSHMEIASSDPALLEKATRTAEEFACRFMRDDVAGIAYLGALVRGYFDRYSDIDIAVFGVHGIEGIALPQYQHVDGFEIHCDLAGIDAEAAATWGMAKRWAFSQASIRYDPQGRLRQLLEQKVPLKPEERRWLMISGITQSQWYIDSLTQTWVDRGSVLSAHGMFGPGLDHFFEALFGLNDRLVADFKWRLFYAERLDVLPTDFHSRMTEVMKVRALDEEELKRRRDAFMAMWHELLPLIEKEVGMRFDEFKDTV